MTLTVGGHQGPRCLGTVGAGHGVFHGDAVVVPFFAVAPVFVGEFVPLVGGLGAVFEALELFLGTDVQPELAHHRTVIHQLRLEVVDLVECTLPLVAPAKRFDPLHEDAAIPAPVEDQHLARLGEMTPEAPQVRPGALFVAGRGNRHDLEEPRIQRVGEAADHAPLASGISAFKHHHGGLTARPCRPDPPCKLSLGFGQLLVGSLLAERGTHVERCQCLRASIAMVARDRYRRSRC